MYRCLRWELCCCFVSELFFLYEMGGVQLFEMVAVLLLEM